MYKKTITLILVLGMVLSLVACTGGGGNNQTGTNDSVTTIKWYIGYTQPTTGLDEVIAEANKYLEQKINVHLDLVFVDPGNFDQKMQMVMAAGEQYDLVFTTGAWLNKFEGNVDKGAFLPLDDLLNQTPKLKALFMPQAWEATSVKGKIYGVPMLQALFDQRGIQFVKSLVDKYNLPVTDVKTMDELTPILQVIKDNEGSNGIIPAREGYMEPFTPMATTVRGFNIIDGKVTDNRDQLEPKWEITRDWYNKGFFPADAATLKDEDTLVKAQKLFSVYQRQLPGINEKSKIKNNYDVIQLAPTPPLLYRDSIQSAMTAISSTSKNPLKALQVLELTQTDEYLLNLLCYGIEGRDWKKDPANPKRMLAGSRNADSFYLPEFEIGNQFLACLAPDYPDNVWEETIAENNSAPVDPNMGFVFDSKPVETELLNIDAINTEYLKIMKYGLEDPSTVLPEYDKKMDTAGKQKVMDEIQKQYDAWKAGL